MKIAMPLVVGRGGVRQAAVELADFEDAGVDAVSLGEAYTFDAVSALGYLAAKTERIELYTAILNVYSRTPSLLAMTAAGLDDLSGGRFRLGVGASGPQVVEGFHGVRYDAQLGRLREVASICRTVWAREPLDHEGRHYQIPLAAPSGERGRPLKLVNRPQRPKIPMVLAALGPKSVTLAAELYDAWQPMFFYPERVAEVLGQAVEEGLARRSGDLGPLEVWVDTSVCIARDAEEEERALLAVRRQLALYVGGMGSAEHNFYNRLVARYGFEEEARRIQQLYLGGRTAEAERAVPEELIRGVSLIGDLDKVGARLQAHAAAGVTALVARPLAATHDQRLRTMEELRGLGA